jgi:VanZ family protein
LVACLGVVLLVVLSVMPQPPELPLEQGDKLGHVAAYAALTLWWMQLFLLPRQRYQIAAAFIVLGVLLEWVQGWTGLRSFSYADMAADTLGVALGWLAAPPRLPSMLERAIGFAQR